MSPKGRQAKGKARLSAYEELLVNSRRASEEHSPEIVYSAGTAIGR